jgi:FixJ family two-component response regulator
VFDTAGLYGVADQLGCDPEDALDVLLNARLVPFVSSQRRALLRELVALRGLSHVDAAEALNISRWTVATHRSALGLDRRPSSCARRANR